MASAKSILRYFDKKRACIHKEQHASRGAAEAHLRALLKKDPNNTEMQVYPCVYGNHWHVGHRLGNGIKRKVKRYR